MSYRVIALKPVNQSVCISLEADKRSRMLSNESTIVLHRKCATLHCYCYCYCYYTQLLLIQGFIQDIRFEGRVLAVRVNRQNGQILD